MKVISRKYDLRTGTKIRTVRPRFKFWHYSSITAIGKRENDKEESFFVFSKRK